MQLQTFILPQNDRDCPEMFYRGGIGCKDGVELSKGSMLTLDTYFNSFSYTKYREYTRVLSVCVTLCFSGNISARLIARASDGLKCLAEADSCSGRLTLSAKLDGLPDDGFIYPEIKALDDSVLLGGDYSSDVIPDDINAAIAICTFKREQYILHNLEVLRGYDFRYIRKVFVSDNGNTLDHDALSNEFISVLPNKNYGGSGGFSRGMLEALDGGYSHVILMDDDVEFYPEVLERITVFMSLLKEEYKNSRFSAAMLFLSDNSPYLQWEMGGKWNGNCIEGCKRNADVRDIGALIECSDNNNVDYGAWWCFCMPVSAVEQYGVSMPFFIKMDDVEYSLRLKQEGPVITMNGAAIFHESFEKKMNMALDYYTIRNELVTAALHGSNVLQAVKLFIFSIGKHLMLYRYDNIPLILKAAKDFLSGPQFFLDCDEEQLNNEIRKCAPRMIPLSQIDEWDEKLMASAPTEIRKGNKLKAFFSAFLPAFCLDKKITAVAIPFASPVDFIRKKAVIQYQLDGDTGILTKRSFFKFMKYGVISALTALRLFIGFSRVSKQFVSRRNELTSVDFWRKHLGLQDR